MGYIVKEEFGSNQGDGSECTVDWLVRWDGQDGPPTFVGAYNEAWVVTDGTFNGLPRQDIELDEIVEVSTGAKQRGHWRATVTYSQKESDRGAKQTGQQPNPSDLSGNKDTFSFEITLEDKIERYPQEGHARWTWDTTSSQEGTNFTKRMPEGLGFEGEEKGFAGLSVPRPKVAFSFDAYLANNLVNGAYLNNVTRTVGAVNHTPWNAWGAGEIMCVGARGQSDGSERWLFNFSFQAAKNRHNVYAGQDVGIVPFMGAWSVVETEWHKKVVDLGGGKERTQDLVRQLNVWYPFERRIFEDNLFPLVPPTNIMSAWEPGYTFPNPQTPPEWPVGTAPPLFPGQPGYPGVGVPN